MDLGFDPMEVLRLPTAKKAAIFLAIIILVAGGYWYFFMQDVQGRIETLEKKLTEQEETISMKRRQLANLPKLRAELVVLKKKEEKAAQKLPSKKEIPTLLTGISEAGHEYGLEFLLFEPKAELNVEIHTEVPVDIRIRGLFHQTVFFMDHVTRMSRIATFSNITMTGMKDLIDTKMRLTTYRFLDIEETEYASAVK